MKLNKIFAALVAVLALAVSCQKEASFVLAELQVSSSYIGIPADGGQVTIDLTATDSWAINDIPEWLTISPASGAAGATKVTFSAEAASDSREVTLYAECAGKKQTIIVLQRTAAAEVPVSTCAEVLAGPDSKTYRITGPVTKITETATYGNFYINDGTGEVYIYGTKYQGQTKQAALEKLGVEVGDILTVEGPKTTYNGTVELVDVDVINIVKSLLKVSPDAISMPSKGGEAEITLFCKGNGLDVQPQEDWISIANINVAADSTVVKIRVAENNGDPRNGSIVIKTSIPGQVSSATVAISQAGLSGTLATPFTVAQAIEYCKNLGTNSTEDFYIKGKVTKIQSQFGAQYGNGTFWISDDGTDSVSEDKKSTADADHDFEVFRALWLGNQKWTESNYPLSEGDEVIICGKVTLYNGLAETVSGKAYVYSVNGLTSDAEGLGSLNAPLTVKGAIAAAANAPTNVYVKGKVSYIASSGFFNASYGNATFWISDDGVNNGVAEDGKSTTATDRDFEVYRTLYLGNRKWVEGDTQIAVGDEVVILGNLTVYNGISETASGKSYIYSLNGVTE